tara:strand:+ start:1704 stop:3383 length:1680 start_codon:yes stop_codon:yes gene_type:complete
MGISFLEGLGYVAQGALEKDEQIRQERLQARMEEMKENRALYKEIAKTRYATDLSTYEKESANLANMEKALKAIGAGDGMNKRQAAMTLIEADANKFNLFKELGDDDKEMMILSTMSGFKDRIVDGKVLGFEVVTPLSTPVRPNEHDYFDKKTKDGEDFWKEYAKEIRTNTDGPLSRQVKKLLGRDVDPSGQLEMDYNVQGTKIRGDLRVADTFSSNTKEPVYSFKEGILKNNFNKSMDGIDVSFYDDAVSSRNSVLLAKAPATENIMATLNTIIPNFQTDYVTKWDRDSGDITLSAEGSLYYQQMKQLYQETEKIYFGESFYSGGSRSGKDWSTGEFLEIFRNEVSNRTIQIDSEKYGGLFGLGFGGEKQLESVFVLNTRVLPVGTVLTSTEKELFTKKLNDFVSTEEFRTVTGGANITNSITEAVVNKGASQIIAGILKNRTEEPPTLEDSVRNIVITEEMIKAQMEEHNKTRAEVIQDFLDNPVKDDGQGFNYTFIFPSDFDFGGEATAQAEKDDAEYQDNALRKPNFQPTGPLKYSEWLEMTPEEVQEAYNPKEE